MKKRLLLIALASTMLLAACNKNNNESQGEAVFTATTEHQGGRTSLDPNNGNINWTAGDQIVIANANDESAIFSLRSGVGTTEGGFGTADDFNTVGPFVAAYPETATIANDVVTFNLPATQAMGETGTFANGANPMVACSDDKNLQFKNLCGGLGIRLKGVGAHVSAVRITSKNTTEKLWGAFEVSNCAANEPTLTEASGNQGTNVVTLTCDVTLTTAAKTFFVMLPPGTLANGFTMEVLDGDEVLATKETDSDVALVERNNVKVFNDLLIDLGFNGNVEVPSGIDPSIIVVTNFDEEVIPDENGYFYIDPSNILVAKNAETGNLIYFTINSVEFNNRTNANNELSAKETALSIALKMLPFNLANGNDDVLSRLKEILYDLQPVRDLESSIISIVGNYHELKEEEVKAAAAPLRQFMITEFNSIITGSKLKPESLMEDNTMRSIVEEPYFPVDMLHGTKAVITDLTHNPLSDMWRMSCTLYNGLDIMLCAEEGTATYVGDHEYTYDPCNTSHRYYIPASSLTRVEEILTLRDWAGLKEYCQDFLHHFDDPNFSPLGLSRIENAHFDVYDYVNMLCFYTPKDDIKTAVGSVFMLSLDLASLLSIPLNGNVAFDVFMAQINEIIDTFCSDANFNYQFQELHSSVQQLAQNGNYEALTTQVGELCDLVLDKFLEVISDATSYNSIATGLGETLVDQLITLIPQIRMLDYITGSVNVVLSFVSHAVVQSFGLPISYRDVEVPEGINVYTFEPEATQSSASFSGVVTNTSQMFTPQILDVGFLYRNNDEGDYNTISMGEWTVGSPFASVVQNLSPDSPYQVVAYASVVVSGHIYYYYGEVVNFTTGNVHDYVDLGLPSGLLWATCNVGANAPEEYGDYFAWGETQPKDMYNWSTYQYCNGSYTTLTKYCNSSPYGNNGFTDNLTTLLPEDDAATANWGSGWRMPTQAEFQELLDNTTVTLTQQNGVNGRLFTASNGNSLFLPAAGDRYGSSLYHAGSNGYYRASSLSASYPFDAWRLYFGSGGIGMYNDGSRDRGASVRPVRSSGQK